MSAITVLPQAVYRRTEPSRLRTDVRLLALEWALYFAVTGRHTVAELGKQMRAEAPERDAAFGRLLSLGLIEEQPLDASEYVTALAAAGDRDEQTLREFLMRAAQPPAIPAALPAPAPPAALRVVPHARRGPQPAFGFKPLPSPEEETRENHLMSRSRKLSLRALMDLIEKQADSREAGQLDIYRVFVRVDTLLLRRSGIETLRFTEDRLVYDPELEQAIIRSVKKTLGLDCPESVWVEVA